MEARQGFDDVAQTPSWFWGIFAVIITLGIFLFFAQDQAPYLVEYPRDWVIPLRFVISDWMQWLIKEFDLGFFTFKELTRSIAW